MFGSEKLGVHGGSVKGFWHAILARKYSHYVRIACQEKRVPVIVIANPKGGVGKSTLATNLAGCLARRGRRVMLGDIDAQQSSRSWLALRPPGLPAIAAWDVGPDRIARPPRGVTHVVLDTPAGMAGAQLQRALRIADRVVVPLQPSMFDILATQVSCSNCRRCASMRRSA